MSALALDTLFGHQLPTPMPRGVRKAVLDKQKAYGGDWDTFTKIEAVEPDPNDPWSGGEQYVTFVQAPEPVVDLNEANIITSLLPWKINGENAHAPVLDLDFPHEYTLEDGVGVVSHDVAQTMHNTGKAPSWWLDQTLILNDLTDIIVVTQDDIQIPGPHLYLPSSTPGHAHLYLDTPMREGKFFAILKTLKALKIVENGYCDASLHRGYSAVRCPWIKKTPTEVAHKTHYKEVLQEIDAEESMSLAFDEVIAKHGYTSKHQAANELGMKLMYGEHHHCYVGLENHSAVLAHFFDVEPSKVVADNFEEHLPTLKFQAEHKKQALKGKNKLTFLQFTHYDKNGNPENAKPKVPMPKMVENLADKIEAEIDQANAYLSMMPKTEAFPAPKGFANGGVINGDSIKSVYGDEIGEFLGKSDEIGEFLGKYGNDEKLSSAFTKKHSVTVKLTSDTSAMVKALMGVGEAAEKVKTLWQGTWADATKSPWSFSGPIFMHDPYSGSTLKAKVFKKTAMDIFGTTGEKVFTLSGHDDDYVVVMLPEVGFKVYLNDEPVGTFKLNGLDNVKSAIASGSAQGGMGLNLKNGDIVWHHNGYQPHTMGYLKHGKFTSLD